MISKTQIDKFTNRAARLGLIGQGYAGLPLAFTFAESGFETVGFDTDAIKIEKLVRGESYIRHLSSNRLRVLIERGRFHPSKDFSELLRCDAAIICVPTPLGEGRASDLSHIVNTAQTVK